MEPRKKIEINELILELIDGTITDEQFDRLEDWLGSESGAVEYYADFMSNYAEIRHGVAPDANAMPSAVDQLADNEIWPTMLALAESEMMAPSIDIPEEACYEVGREPIRIAERIRVSRKISKFSVFTAIISAAAVLMVVAMVKLNPVLPSVGYLSDSINAEWVVKGDAPISGDVLKQSEEMLLVKGIAQITLEQGAIVTIESPAKFKLEGINSLFLDSGNLTAKVSRYATGFTVHTPSCSVVDLGTEFGVSVEGNGSSRVHMFTGKANILAGAVGSEIESETIVAEQARSVKAGTSVIQTIPWEDGRYVREIDSETGFVWHGQNFNLADVVGGGNGFGTGTIGHVLNLDAGRITPRRYDGLLNKPTSGKCVAIPASPFVDCLFVPDGGIGVNLISLGGTQFENCPDTNGCSFGDISNGGIIQHEFNRSNPLVLDGVTYGTQQQPAIYIHGNQGVTFDLEAIRQALPGIEIVKFSTLYGISQNVAEDPTFGGGTPVSSLWVLVDGKVRSSKEQAKYSDTATEVSIDLTGQDRYLSLVVTDFDGNHGFSWGVFAMPKLELRRR